MIELLCCAGTLPPLALMSKDNVSITFHFTNVRPHLIATALFVCVRVPSMKWEQSDQLLVHVTKEELHVCAHHGDH